VEGIAVPEAGQCFSLGRLWSKSIALRVPEGTILIDDLCCLRVINPLEQAATNAGFAILPKGKGVYKGGTGKPSRQQAPYTSLVEPGVHAGFAAELPPSRQESH
jgi:hypothetical protein